MCSRRALYLVGALVVSFILGVTALSSNRVDTDDEPLSLRGVPHNTAYEYQQKELSRLEHWARGAFVFQEDDAESSQKGDSSSIWGQLVDFSVAHLPEVRPIRQRVLRDLYRRHGDDGQIFASLDSILGTDQGPLWKGVPRGGGGLSPASYEEMLEQRLQTLYEQFGEDFRRAIAINKQEHADDCRKSCDYYYCAPSDSNKNTSVVEVDYGETKTTIQSYSMGATPPEDFAEQFGFPLDLIKVSQGEPLFSQEEAAEVIRKAEMEGVDQNEYRSGKYKLGGDWLENLPETRQWFNRRLETTFFPMFAKLFPEIVSSPSVLRAHSVSLLKYNSSHPRTDVHVDNGILALTVAMTPQTEYSGGGTFFEHMGVQNVLPMDVGHATLRPGSIRHGGHRVTSGTRYILGCFLLLEDRVEHVRRLKNRGSALRRHGDLEGAAKHFEWALALNPKCTTCMKDWAEILHTQKHFIEAETKIRGALELLENSDSDALFTLGVILSDQGRDDEAIAVYQQSIALNAEDAELCYNLGIKLGAKGRTKEEIEMYEKAIKANPSFGGPWLNWGTALAESGDLEGAEAKFVQALGCDSPDVVPKAMMNLALVYQIQGEQIAMSGNLEGAKSLALQASKFADDAKPLLEDLMKTPSFSGDSDLARYLQQFQPQRLRCHRLLGQIFAGMGNLPASEAEFREATRNFPSEAAAWQMLGRVLDVQGKTEEAVEVAKTVQNLLQRRKDP